MSGNATIVLLLIGSFVWGGFLLILLTAIGKERQKTAAEAGGPGVSAAGPSPSPTGPFDR
jgi:hypothetical protein